MSVKTQPTHMKKLAELLSRDLGYIHGERESGPNGAKHEFLIKGRAFMSALAKDLGFSEYAVSVNKAGVACSGEIYLRGIWSGFGLKMELSQSCIGYDCLHYWPIESINARNMGQRQAITLDELKAGDYPALLSRFLCMKERGYGRKAA